MIETGDCISRKALFKIVEDYASTHPVMSDNELFALFCSIPAADVRPVVLCRDCLHYEMGVCLKIYDDGAANKDAWQDRKPDDFCSCGEKREEI